MPTDAVGTILRPPQLDLMAQQVDRESRLVPDLAALYAGGRLVPDLVAVGGRPIRTAASATRDWLTRRDYPVGTCFTVVALTPGWPNTTHALCVGKL